MCIYLLRSINLNKNKMKELFTVGTKDFIKGLVVAIGTTLLTGLTVSLNSGALPNNHDLKVMGLASLSAGVAYLGKQFLTNSNGQLAVKEPCVVPPTVEVNPNGISK